VCVGVSSGVQRPTLFPFGRSISVAKSFEFWVDAAICSAVRQVVVAKRVPSCCSLRQKYFWLPRTCSLYPCERYFFSSSVSSVVLADCADAFAGAAAGVDADAFPGVLVVAAGALAPAGAVALDAADAVGAAGALNAVAVGAAATAAGFGEGGSFAQAADNPPRHINIPTAKRIDAPFQDGLARAHPVWRGSPSDYTARVAYIALIFA
jgi:hypothetical protein